MIKTLLKVLVIVAVILGLVLPLLTLRAEETAPTKPQLLQEVGDLTDELIALKDNKELTPGEKEGQEIILRKKAILKILDLFLLETADLKEKLGTLKLENSEQDQLRNHLLGLLEDYKAYYLELKEVLRNELSLDDLKKLAHDFKLWRNKNYQKNISLVLNFILVFNEKSALSVASSRLEKIISDLNKLESAKLIQKRNLQGLLNSSIQHLAKALLLNKKAGNLLLLSASSTLANLESEIADAETSNEIRNLVKDALTEIKAAYQNFLEISKKVKQQLGF